MYFAKIKQGICSNVLVFSSKQSALNFDNTLVELKNGFGIGDSYNNGIWSKKELTEEERANEIKKELATLDGTINRATEDLYVLSNLTPYERITQVINRKNELREELSQLTIE